MKLLMLNNTFSGPFFLISIANFINLSLIISPNTSERLVKTERLCGFSCWFGIYSHHTWHRTVVHEQVTMETSWCSCGTQRAKAVVSGERLLAALKISLPLKRHRILGIQTFEKQWKCWSYSLVSFWKGVVVNI